MWGRKTATGRLGTAASVAGSGWMRCRRNLVPKVLAIVLISASAALAAPAADQQHKQVAAIVASIMKADYEGDRAALKSLYAELAPFAGDKKMASRVRYWLGFALWRRALNGYNDAVAPKELEQDLNQAVDDFRAAFAADPGFVDAKVAAGACFSYLVFLNQKDAARVQELAAQGRPLLQEAEAAAPDNPRVLWVLGARRWFLGPERGGGQDRAMQTYQQGLEAIRNRPSTKGDPLEPSWGEPELLMNLAWSNLNRTAPDLEAAEQNARAALALVPYWHYLRDILLPQIQEAKNKRSVPAGP